MMYHYTISTFMSYKNIPFTECQEQTYGLNCNQTCHCASGSCHHVPGSCDSGCDAGWTGDACQEPIKQGICQQNYYDVEYNKILSCAYLGVRDKSDKHAQD